MHHSALKIGEIFFNTYASNLVAGRVIDLGSQDINGSLKQVCPDRFEYLGVDFVPGRGVDIVLTDPYVLPFESNIADIVVCSSVFEHVEFFWVLFLEVMRVLKPTGLLYLSAPSNGEFHRYPVDCWRFYPDAGSALVRWAERNGVPAALMESFIGEQDGDQWNDFVAVILKDRVHIDQYRKRILDEKRDFSNGKTSADVDVFSQHRSMSEDQFRIFEIRRLASAPLAETTPHAQTSDMRGSMVAVEDDPSAELVPRTASEATSTVGESMAEETKENQAK